MGYLAAFLNIILKLPIPRSDFPRPFPEGFALRGLLWTEHSLPDTFRKKLDEEEKCFERASTTIPGENGFSAWVAEPRALGRISYVMNCHDVIKFGIMDGFVGLAWGNWRL
jgi:hypothetical protein